MTTRKGNKSRRTNGNGNQPVNKDLDDAENSLWRATSILETTYTALEQASEATDGDGVIRAINTLRIGLDALKEVDTRLQHLGFRLFHEGCPPEDVKKLQRESTPPAIHILRSSRTSAQKVKALQKVMGVRPS